MKVIICGSISAADEILSVKEKLEGLGCEVEIPEGVKNLTLRERVNVPDSEKALDKIQHDLIRGYFEKIKNCDAVLVVNPEKKGIANYIGGNTFVEMAFAHVLNKKLYCLNPLPDMPYVSEMIAMQPVIINNDLSLLK